MDFSFSQRTWPDFVFMMINLITKTICIRQSQNLIIKINIQPYIERKFVLVLYIGRTNWMEMMIG